MSVHFHLMTQRQNRIEFFGHDADLTAPSAIGIDEDLLSDEGGVHWSQAFVPYLLLGERAEHSEGQLWASNKAGAQIELSVMIAQTTTAMQYADPCADYYASRSHFAKMLSLLYAAQAYAAIHPERVFVINWF